MRYQLMILLILISPLTVPAQRTTRRAPLAQPAVAAASNSDRTLPIRRVILYSNGVAYIERRGTVSGHAEIDLSFKQSQVDDVLKSMVVLDLGQGRIGAVSYNSSAPPSARMADIPFSIAAQTPTGASGGLAGVLAQLQGARVTVTTTRSTVTGSILTLEQRKTPGDQNHAAATNDAVVIATEGGELSSFDLAEVRSVRLLEDGTRRDIGEFASATASARRRDAKTITVTSDGSGAREMVVSYTVAAPIWKTTYRVVLDAAGKPFFQGWAIVDNVSDEDWTNVQLSLVSGAPISFVQPIQQPFYRYRPIVPIPNDLNLVPQLYESGDDSALGSLSGTITDSNGAVVPGARVTVTNAKTDQDYDLTTNSEGIFNLDSLPPGNYSIEVTSPGFSTTNLENVLVRGGLAASLELELTVAGAQSVVEVSTADVVRYGKQAGGARHRPSVSGSSGPENNYLLDGTNTADTNFAQAMSTLNSGVDTAASGSEIGDLFEYRIDQPITVRRDRSALIPIVQTNMEGERISIYNAEARADRAMSGLLLKNTSTLTLEGGSMTILDGNAYAGEALMERLKPAEQRLISFALDLGTLVTTKQNEDRAPVYRIRAVNGVFQTFHYQQDRKTYSFKNQTDKPRVIYVEHPVRAGWELDKKGPVPAYATGRYYRFRIELAPFEQKDLVVAEQHSLSESVQLSNITREQIALFVSQRYIDDATRAALEHLIDLQDKIAALNSQVNAVDNEVREIGQDQSRLRENIKALAQTAEARQLIARYVAKADQQESRIEELNKNRQAAVSERTQVQQQLAAAIQAFDITRDL